VPKGDKSVDKDEPAKPAYRGLAEPTEQDKSPEPAKTREVLLTDVKSRGSRPWIFSSFRDGWF
jgi:hypothetical protein